MVLTQGDTAILKQVGPALTIEEVYSDTQVICTWMDAMGQRHRGEFIREDLRQIDAAPTGQTSTGFRTDAIDVEEEHSGRVSSGSGLMQLQALALAIVSVFTGQFFLR